MTQGPRNQRDFATMLSTMGIDSASIRPTETLTPAAMRDVHAARLRTMRLEMPDSPTELEFRSVLGVGGMGVVQTAFQRSLRRNVAVKRVKNTPEGIKAASELVSEAWLVGALEHPNIVPIYTLTKDETGMPVLVMKQIDGVSWIDILNGKNTRMGPAADEDPLEYHIQILIEVCKAIHYAHSKGVIHRDIKPDNVMIGSYGEVYVLDWGLAVALSDDGTGRFPVLRPETRFAGTAAYMAPEMASADFAPLSARSDVYLLGGVLHEILTGDFPHHGENVYETLYNAVLSKPKEYPSDVPAELQTICRKAMARDPSDRYPTADDFRRALVEFLHHRESYKLTRDADQRLVELQRAIREGADQTEVYRRFGGCRFGYEAALDIWSDNPLARAGMQEAIESMVQHHVLAEQPDAARSFLNELPMRNRKLEQRVEASHARLTAQDFGGALNGRGPMFLAGIVAGGLGLIPFVLGVAQLFGILGQSLVGLRVTCGLFFIALAALLYAMRHELLGVQKHRRFVCGAGIVFAASILVHLYGAVRGLPLGDVVSAHFVAFAAILASVGITSDMRLALGALPYAIGIVLVALFPGASLVVFGLANLAALAATARVWLRWTPRPRALR